MNCPYCSYVDTKVYDSRESKDGNSVKRRRECTKCTKRFLTIEKIIKLSLEVQKRDGTKVDFNLDKIRTSVLKCCEKRPITFETVEKILESVLEYIKKTDDAVIKTKTIGRHVLSLLKDVDEIAFLKYAIIHNKYQSINSFVSEIEKLKTFKNLDYKD
jgi:transcriptional repressor NrdR